VTRNGFIFFVLATLTLVIFSAPVVRSQLAMNLPQAGIKNVLASAAFAIGAFVSVVNFYLSFLRYPIHRWKHSAESYRHVSVIPLIGSLLLLLALLRFHSIAWLSNSAIALILIDTGGIHWFLISLVLHCTFHRSRGDKD
jgi:hypothetical protein